MTDEERAGRTRSDTPIALWPLVMPDGEVDREDLARIVTADLGLRVAGPQDVVLRAADLDPAGLQRRIVRWNFTVADPAFAEFDLGRIGSAEFTRALLAVVRLLAAAQQQAGR